jgi:hypothetical protein
MSKSNTFENDLLKLIFQNTDVADIGDAAGLQNSATTGFLYVSLHTAALDDTSVQNTSEIAYTNYTRVGVTRTSGGWTITNNTVNPTAAISFPTAGASGGATATWFAVGVAASGATKILYKGTIAPSIVVSEGVTPQLTTQTAITED